MKDLFKKLDQKYLKICLYAAVTVLLTVGIGAIMLGTGPFWAKLWSICSAVIRPIILGGIICYLFLPIVNWFEKLLSRGKESKLARMAAVILTFVIVLAAIGMILVLIIVVLYRNLEAINLESIQNLFTSLQADYAEIWAYLAAKLEESNISPDNMTGIVTGITSAISGFFSGLLFGVIFSIYFLLDDNRIAKYWGRAFRLIFGEKAQDALTVFAKDADRAFSGYIRGQFTDALIVGVLVTVVLSLARVPYAVLVGVFAGLGNMIPYVGPVVGYLTLVVVCLPTAAFDKMLIGVVLLAVIMFVDGNIINPKLLSDNVEVHPLLVVAALIAGGAVGGIAGMLVAVPTAALIKLQFDRYLEKLEENKDEPA